MAASLIEGIEDQAATLRTIASPSANKYFIWVCERKDLYTDVGNLGVQLYGWRRAEYGRKSRKAVASSNPSGDYMSTSRAELIVPGRPPKVLLLADCLFVNCGHVRNIC